MVRAYVNFALIKYWGKLDNELKLPYQASLSFTIDNLYTDTSVTYDKSLLEDVLYIDNKLATPKESLRVRKHMDYIRKQYNFKDYAIINSINKVPKAAGLASSASAFAALTVAAVNALGINEEKEELSRIARIGSGSASRSIYGDFVIWNTGTDNTSIATKLDLKWDDFRILVCLISKDEKNHSSSDAMDISVKSKEYSKWVSESKIDLDNMLVALNNKDIDLVGSIAEKNSNHMHDLIESTGIKYKNDDSINLINRIYNLREKGIKAYYTMDAGPNIKIITIKDEVDIILEELNDIEVIICKSGNDAHTI